MNGEDKASAKGPGAKAGSGYDVGYRKPPAQHQFPKGKSGNPHGRPKKQAACAGEVAENLLGATRSSNLILAEGYQSLKLRDANGITDVSATQAVLRGLLKNALGGNRLAQKDYLNFVQATEKERRAEGLETFKGFVDYKGRAERELASRQKRGISIDDILPHPDDVIIDPFLGTVYVDGPISKKELAHGREAAEVRDGFQLEVSAAAQRHSQATTSRTKACALADWLHHQWAWDLINDRVANSLKAELKDRSHAAGATRSGSMKLGNSMPHPRLRKKSQ